MTNETAVLTANGDFAFIGILYVTMLAALVIAFLVYHAYVVKS